MNSNLVVKLAKRKKEKSQFFNIMEELNVLKIPIVKIKQKITRGAIRNLSKYDLAFR